MNSEVSSSAPTRAATSSYVSTRGGARDVSFNQVLLESLAPDGGLYAPTAWPRFDVGELTRHATAPFTDIAFGVMREFVGAAFSDARLRACIDETYAGFDHPAVAPLTQLDAGLFVLELYHGPTLAFKDVAMQLIARLISEALAQSGEKLLLLTATSGDTGAAAARAFAGAPGVALGVLHPHERVSPLQRRQMTTTGADNVLNIAVDGDFDACQRLMRGLLADKELRAGRLVSSVNSINWGRLCAQAPYYFSTIAALGAGGGPVRFVVPTGNFGDAFAGWAARRMGAEGVRLLAAVNDNDALAHALNTGEYARKPAVETASVSMDVQAPSNLERLIFEASGRNGEETRALFSAFETEGRTALPDALLHALRREVDAVSIVQSQADAAMRSTYERTGFLACPHTAVALAAAARAPFLEGPTVILSTAHPAKFPDAVFAGAGVHPQTPQALTALGELTETFERAPADAETVAKRLRAFAGERLG